MTDREHIEAAIAAQEHLRGTVSDEVIDLTIAALRQKLAAAPTSPRRSHATVR
jgi:hypothetical protein